MFLAPLFTERRDNRPKVFFLGRRLLACFLIVIIALTTGGQSCKAGKAEDTQAIKTLLEKLKGDKQQKSGLAGLASALGALKEKLSALLGRIQGGGAQQENKEIKKKVEPEITSEMETKLKECKKLRAALSTSLFDLAHSIKQNIGVNAELSTKGLGTGSGGTVNEEQEKINREVARGKELEIEARFFIALIELAQLISYDAELYEQLLSQDVDDQWLFGWREQESETMEKLYKLSYFRRLTVHGGAASIDDALSGAQQSGESSPGLDEMSGAHSESSGGDAFSGQGGSDSSSGQLPEGDKKIDLLTLARALYKSEIGDADQDDAPESDSWLTSIKNWFGFKSDAGLEKEQQKNYDQKNRALKYNLIQKSLYLLAKLHDQLARVTTASESDGSKSERAEIKTREDNIIKALNLALEKAGESPEITPVVSLITEIFLPASSLIRLALERKKNNLKADALSQEVDKALYLIGQESASADQYSDDDTLVYASETTNSLATSLRLIIADRKAILEKEAELMQKSQLIIAAMPIMPIGYSLEQIASLIRSIDSAESELAFFIQEDVKQGPDSSAAQNSSSFSYSVIDHNRLKSLSYSRLRRLERQLYQLKTIYEELVKKIGYETEDALDNASKKNTFAPDKWNEAKKRIVTLLKRKKELSNLLVMLKAHIKKEHDRDALIKRLDSNVNALGIAKELSEKNTGGSVSMTQTIFQFLHDKIKETIASKSFMDKSHDLLSYHDERTGENILHKLINFLQQLQRQSNSPEITESQGQKSSLVVKNQAIKKLVLSAPELAGLSELVNLVRTQKAQLFKTPCYLGLVPFEKAVLAGLSEEFQNLFDIIVSSETSDQDKGYTNSLGWNYATIKTKRTSEVSP